MTAINAVTDFAVEGDVGVITLNSPPVNALSAAVRDGLAGGMAAAAADPAVKAVVIVCEGRTFIAGADITEFGGAQKGASLYDVQAAIENSPKPVVAAIHGTALGGGLEVALTCHYRVAVPSARCGLPEVNLGLLPGAGGTQRLPRVVGVEKALEMMTSGQHVPAKQCLEMGLVDELVEEGKLREGAIAFAKKIVAEHRPLKKVREQNDKVEAARDHPEIFANFRKANARKFRGFLAPEYNIRCIEAAVNQPFDEGMKTERKLFGELMSGSQSAAQRYAFFAERQANKVPDVPDDTAVIPVNKVGIIGGGTMGGGIAMSFADFGVPVKIMDSTQEALDRGMQRIRANYATSVKRGSLAEDEMQRRLVRIEPVAGYDDIKDANIVVEAVFEEMDVKQPIFAKLDEVMKPGALLLSNTSALDIDQLAAMTHRPGDVAGAHFFSPANVMKLLEVVRGAKTSPETLLSVMQMGRRIGKIAAVAGNCDGFLANRSRAPFNTEMVILLEEGCLPEQVDKVMVDFGYPMGPFAVGDLAGLDISAAGRRRRAAANPNYRKLPIADRLVELGHYGQKTGAGWYRYEKGDRTPHPDPEVAAIIKQVSTDMGVPQRTFTDQEILRHLLFSSLNEACKILEEGIAYRASDIDVMWLHGFGFPRYRGGLMFWADGIGVRDVYNQIAAWHQQYGERWAPAALLRQLAETGTPFREAKLARRD